MKRAGGIVVVSASLYFALMYATHRQTTGLSWDSDLMTAVVRPFLLYLFFYFVMCCGILFSAAFRLIKLGPEYIDSPLVPLRQSFRSQSFILGILVSPIVFAAVTSQFETQVNWLASTLLAFQNGFFWENMFRKASPAEVA